MKHALEKKPKYYLDRDGGFVIENYNHAKPFANFFPGIAGKFGIPMWVFYVNRGQAISSFGIKSKDQAILEFYPANKAWQVTPSCGFRTFIKLTQGAKTILYEPFHNGSTNLEFDLVNKMRITSHGLSLQEHNRTLNLEVNVDYFNIPNDSYAGLARIVSIKSLGRKTRSIQLLDGLPQIVPFGTNHWCLKEMSRTIEAWMNIENLENSVPFYKLAVDPSDRPEVVHIKEGNFYLAFHYENNAARLIRPIVEPQHIFGPVTDFSCPRRFLSEKKFRAPRNEQCANMTPCAFMFAETKLEPGMKKTFYAIAGYMRSLKTLNASVGRITAAGYLTAKKDENRKVIAELENNITTSSSCREYDLYAKQTYLDNIMRGGYPHVFNSGQVFYLYSRKHGDLERDYNKFLLQPTYFSQGNGNYRDANQNRRSDIWFNPEIKEENIVSFFNLIQADGFNPLVIKGASFMAIETGLGDKIKGLVDEKHLAAIQAFVKKPFTPGELIMFLKEKEIVLKVTREEFLEVVISYCRKSEEAEHGDGFWTDHWAYNLDLLESYLGVYPENSSELFFKKKIFTFFDNIECVRPRQEKYVRSGNKFMQLHSVALDHEKKEMIAKRTASPHLLRTLYGEGEVYQTTLINKLLCLLANKLASLDPFGVGVEMEANKPNWFDSLNGLPALFGSSSCETFELKRLALIMKETLLSNKIERVQVTEEIHKFLIGLEALIDEYYSGSATDKDYQYWDKSYTLKEEYRSITRLGFSGSEAETSAGALISILDKALRKINDGLAKARDKGKGLYSSYFINEVTECRPLKESYIMPLRFAQKRLPLFLEGQMHGLRLAQTPQEAKTIYEATKKSPLYDKKLEMYKVTAPLAGMPEEIGRCRVFTPGWLENESIWMHMEYKYLLEMLKQGLYEEFYHEFKKLLIPFQKASRYGRSILENSSFLVSSAFPEKDLHGNGFVARLSGSTAEFLHIWLLTNIGPRPFTFDAKTGLSLRLRPTLAGWMFDKKEKTYGFNFLSKTWVTYHNPHRKNTFGPNKAQINKIMFNDKDGALVELHSEAIPSPYASQIRSRQIKYLDIFLK